MKRKQRNRLLMRKLSRIHFQEFDDQCKYSESTNEDIDACISCLCYISNRSLTLTERCYDDLNECRFHNRAFGNLPWEYKAKGFHKIDYLLVSKDGSTKYPVIKGVKYVQIKSFFELLKYLGEVETFLDFDYTAPYNSNEPVSEDWLKTVEMLKQHQINKQTNSLNNK